MSETSRTVEDSSDSASERRLAATRATTVALREGGRWAEAGQAVLDTLDQAVTTADPAAGGDLDGFVYVAGGLWSGTPDCGRRDSFRPPRAISPRQATAMRAMVLVNGGCDREMAVAAATEALETSGSSDPGASWYALLALAYADEVTLAREYVDRVVSRQRNGLPAWQSCALTLLRARIAFLAGDLGFGHAELAGLFATGVHPWFLELAVAWWVATLVELGDLDRARDLLSAHNLTGSLAGAADRAELFAARGALYRAAGQPSAAREEYLSCGAELMAFSVVNPAVISWQAPAALCAHELRWNGMAVALAQQELIAAKRWGTRRTRGQALQAVAMVDADDDVELLTDAVDLLSDPTMRRELTSAQYELGVRLNARRQYEQGARAFRSAGRTATSIGSSGWRRRIASAERCWRASGGARALKRRETMIALLARAGLSNREISGRLHVTDRTVEFHLSNVYRKLGIVGRDQLRFAALPSV